MTEAMMYSPRAHVDVRRNQISRIEGVVGGLCNPVNGAAQRFREGTLNHLAAARGWLGKALGTLGGAYPYPESMDPSSQEIAPPAYDKSPMVSTSDLISGIKQCRVDLESLVAERFPMSFEPHPSGFDRYISLSFTALESAKMTLGEELGCIRDEYEKEAAK